MEMVTGAPVKAKFPFLINLAAVPLTTLALVGAVLPPSTTT